MKTTKRIFACLLIVVMLASMLCVGAGADYKNTNGTITLINATDGVEYSAYRVLDMEVNTTTGAYRYMKNSDWASFIATNSSYFTVDGNYVTAISDAAALAQLAKAAVADKSVTATATASGTSATLTGLTCGYYLLLDEGNSVVALVQLLPGNGTAPAKADVKIKASLPNIAKDVSDSVAYIGQELTYTITVEADVNATNYVITDTAATGITIKDTPVKVTFKGSDITSELSSKITATATSIKVDLSDYLVGKTIGAGDEFVVTYKATLNADAPIATAITNTAKLTYNSGTTIDDTADVYTYQLTVIKKDTNGNLLADAGFKLKNSAGKWAKLDANNKLISWEDNESNGTELTTTAPTGTIVFKGLGDDTYTIHETTVPIGYVATEDKTATITDGNVEVTITNNPGNPLPETGGIGTTVFYAAGGMLVMAALVILLTKKRTVTE